MFDSLIHFFYVILYQPLFNALVLLYDYVPGHDFGVAIIILTLVIRFILYPISVVALNSQKNLQKLQPKIKEIQKKYKDDKEKLAKETLELYKTEKINPFSGLLLSLIQIPILIALYQVFWNGLKPDELVNLYQFVSNPGYLSPLFLGILDLSKANIILAIIAGLTQYFQTKMLLPKTELLDKKKGKEADFAQIMQKQMVYFFPVFTVIILLGLPSALGLYWTVSGLFSIIQQYFILKKDKKIEPIKT
ncbi:MAG: YidC/Oxa1 family membrane protein insertase [Candidatus Staskawiczbacteria bacterium]|nr:YidC/Oxa1 family membrane protein insertase [Candidatus Staskawiczbacteria bacterium]